MPRHNHRHSRTSARPAAARRSGDPRPGDGGSGRIRQDPRPGLCRRDAASDAAHRAPGIARAHLRHPYGSRRAATVGAAPGCQTLDYSAPAEKSGHLDRVEVESPVRDKAETLADLLCAISDAGQRRTIVFVNHRESAERLHELLRRDGIKALKPLLFAQRFRQPAASQVVGRVHSFFCLEPGAIESRF